MKMALLILRKDISRLKWLLLTWFVVVIAKGLFIVGPVIDHYQVYDNLIRLQPAFAGLDWLLLVILIPLLIHGEPLVGTKAFWYTRPLSRRAVLAAKMLFIGLFIVLPNLVVQLAALATNNISPHYLFLAAPEIFCKQATVIIPVIVLASVTASFARYIVAGIIALVVMAVWGGLLGLAFAFFNDITVHFLKNPLIYQANPYNMSLEKSTDLLKVFVTLFTGVLLITHQFLTRRTARTVSGYVFSLFLILFIGRFWSVDFLGINPIVNSRLDIANSVSVVVDNEPGVIWEGFRNCKKRCDKYLMASFAQEVKGLPAQYFTQIDQVEDVRLRYADGYSVWEKEEIDTNEQNELKHAKCQQSLNAALADTIIVNPFFPIGKSYAWMLDTKLANVLHHREQVADYFSEGTFKVYEWQVTARTPLRKNQQTKTKVGLTQIKVYDIVPQEHGVSVFLGEKSITSNLVVALSVPSSCSYSGYPCINYAIYVIRNTKTGEAFLMEEENYLVSSWNKGEGEILEASVRELVFKDVNNRQYGTLPKITEAWLRDAELIRLRVFSVGYFTKPIHIAGVKLQKKNDESEQDGVRRERFVTGEIQYEYYTKPTGFDCKEYYKFGGLRKEWFQGKNGMAEGPAREFYPTGELFYEYSYVNNNIDGVVRKYSKEGQLLTERAYSQAKDLGPLSK